MFRTISAKYPGICRRCNGSISVGDKMRYGGPGRLYHLAKDCPASSEQSSSSDTRADIAAADLDHLDDSTAAAVYSSSRRDRYGSRYTRFSSGAESYTNARGRCEDAPCCGCCS
jgi:hypothetical protein